MIRRPSHSLTLSSSQRPRRLHVLGLVLTAFALLSTACEMEETQGVDLRRSAANDESYTSEPVDGGAEGAVPPGKEDDVEQGGDAGLPGSGDAGPTEASDASAPPASAAFAVGDTLATTAELNLRKGPGTEHDILVTMPTGAIVSVVAAAPQNGFYNVKYASLTGWASAKFLVAAPGAKVDEFPIQHITTPTPVRAHVQAFANVACGTVGCPDVVSSYHGHQPSVDLALDVFQQKELGDKFAEFGVADKTHRVDYVIWRQRINMRDGSGWTWMEDRGSITQNHYDHVHVSFDP